MKAVLFLSVIYSLNLFALTNNLEISRLTGFMDGAPGGLMIGADLKPQVDSSIWTLSKVEEEIDGKLFTAIAPNVSGKKAMVQFLYKGNNLSNISFQSDRPLSGPLWNANIEEGKIKSFTQCETVGCWTVNGEVCRSLLKNKSIDKIRASINSCIETLAPLESFIWSDKNFIKEIKDAEANNLETMKKSLKHEHLNGKSVFYNDETINNSKFVLYAIKDSVRICEELFPKAALEKSSSAASAASTIPPAAVEPK